MFSCGKSGHFIDVYYKRHGYPLGHKFFNGKNIFINNLDTKQDIKVDSV